MTEAWIDRFTRLALMDDDEGEWEIEHDRLREEWLAAHATAFVEIAISRGWIKENAETWPCEIGDDSFIETYQYNYCPRRSAEADVIACEDPLP